MLLRHGEQALVELVLRYGLIGLDEDDAGARVRGLRGGGASVAVGGGEVLDGFAADEEVFELAVDDDVDRLCGDAFVVDGVGAEEAPCR